MEISPTWVTDNPERAAALLLEMDKALQVAEATTRADTRELFLVSRERLNLLTSFQKDLFSNSINYNQIVMAAGYAAYLTIWAGMAPRMARNDVLISGSFIGLSLTIFVFWNIAMMTLNSFAAQRMMKIFKVDTIYTQDVDAEAFIKLMGEAEMRSARISAPFLVAWPFVLGAGAITALAGLFFLLGTAFWTVIYAAHP